MSAPFEVTVFRKDGGPLTKQISLGPDGSIKSDGSACVMSGGVARRLALSGVSEFASEIGHFKPNEAIAAGRLRSDLNDQVQVVTKSKLNGARHPGVIARTQDYIVFEPGHPALAPIDFDLKGMPPAVAARLEESGGLWSALVSVCKPLGAVARIERASTSAGLFHALTGEPFAGNGGKHVYLLVKDGSDIERFLKVLHERCWLAGLGWMIVGAAGQLLERSIVDRVCGTPERLMFEGPPVLVEPVAQDLVARQPVAIDGEALDTASDCPPLTIVELAKLREMLAKEAHRLAGERARARESFIDRQSKLLSERAGVDLHRARRTIERQCQGVLLPDVELSFDDPELAGTTVADVLADPVRFEGETLADPLEGDQYGKCKAKIMRRSDGSVWINSFAHGGATYELKRDYHTVKAALEKTAKDELAETFVRLALIADLEEDEVEDLRNIVSGRSGITKTALGRKLRGAQRAATERHAQQEHQRRIAERRDLRPQLSVPSPDAEWLPCMSALNDVIGASHALEPPARNPDKRVALARGCHIPSLHFLTSKESNDDDGAG